jgi:predicted outer membrane protein
MSYRIVSGAMGLGVIGLLALGSSCKREAREPARTGDELRAPYVTPTPTSPPMPTPSAPRADERGTPPTREPGGSAPAPGAATDRRALEVLATLHQTNQEEIQMGKLAQERGHSGAVKRFGAMLVRQHTEADQRLVEYAGKNDYRLPTDDPAMKAKAEASQRAMEKLRGLEGAAFDRAFATMMVQGHEEAVTLVTRAREQVTDPELQTLLGDLQPVLERHLEQAKALQAGRTGA